LSGSPKLAPADRPSRLALFGRLDRYVLGLFAGSYCVALLLVIGLFLILDVATHLDEYLRAVEGAPSPTGWQVLHYYLLELPFLYLQLAPFVTLLAGLFTFSKLLRHRELLACLAAGVGTQRVLLPVFLCALVLACSMLGTREWLTERLGDQRDRALHVLVERSTEREYRGLWVKGPGGNPVRIAHFKDSSPPEIRGLEATRIVGDPWVELTASRARWDPAHDIWALTDGKLRYLDDLGRPAEQVDQLEADRALFGFRPRDVLVLAKSRERPLDLSFSEVRGLAARDPGNASWQTLLQVNLTFPMAHLVLLLVGLPLLARQDKRQFEGLAGGFLLCVSYYGVDFLCRTLGMQGALPPLLASWLPLLFFGSLGVVLFSSVRS